MRLIFALVGFLLSILFLFLSGFYWQSIVILSCYYIILASSWNLISGYGGMFLLDIQTYSGISAYVSALTFKFFGLNLALGILMGIVVATIAGTLIALLTLRMQGIFLALTTWAFAEIVRIVISTDYQVTGGGYGIVTPYLFGGSGLVFSLLFVILTASVLLYLRNLIESGFGKMLVAVRQDPIGAAACGVNVYRIRVQANLIVGLLSGASGGILAHYVGIVSPSLLQFDEMTTIIVAVIMGGYGTLLGPVIGGALVTFMLSEFQQFGQWRLVVFAIVSLVIVRFYRGGIMGFIRRVYRHLLMNNQSNV